MKKIYLHEQKLLRKKEERIFEIKKIIINIIIATSENQALKNCVF